MEMLNMARNKFDVNLSHFIMGLLLFCAAITLVSVSPPASAVAPQAAGIDYDIVYVRYPRRGDTGSGGVVELPDGENPYSIEPGADLMLLKPDGAEEILVDCRATGQESSSGGEADCSVQDPVISYDGKWVYYAKYVDMGAISTSSLRNAWRRLEAHSLLFKMRLDVPANERAEIQITTVGDGFATDKLAGNSSVDEVREFGIRDLGPTPLPDGRLLFTSNRDAVVAFRQGVKDSLSRVSASTVSQIYVMDDHDGGTPNKNLHLVGHSILHQAQHPTMLEDGRVLFTNWDDAGLREEYATATLYVDHPDGGHLEQFLEPHNTTKRVEHFATQLTSGNVVVSSYYPRMATWGFGTLLQMPVDIDGPDYVAERGDSAEDKSRYFTRIGTEALTPHTTGSHRAPSDLSGRYSTPSAAPNNTLLVSYSDGPVSFNPPCSACVDEPHLDAGIYFIRNADSSKVTNPDTDLVELVNNPNYNEMWPRAVIPYVNIHGVTRPSLTPLTAEEYAPTERDRGLFAGTPTGLTGTSSMQNRESAPLGNDRFNRARGKDGAESGWAVQGADAGLVRNDDLWGVRILVMSPDRYHAPWARSTIERNERLLRDTRSSQHIKGYYTHMSENWKILGEFPVRNSAGLDDPDGEEDTSWLAKIPANTPHLIQSIDRFGMTLSTEQTWRHVNPGDTVASCGGCHAHSLEGVPFTGKWADRSSYQPWDLVNQTPMVKLDNDGSSQLVSRSTTGLWGVEFRRDVLPVLKSKCSSCHTTPNNQPPANNAKLAMFDSTLSGFEADVRTYRAIARDNREQFTHGTTIPAGQSVYHPPQESRYVRALQARSSYFTWQIYNARLDGRANSDLPGGFSSSYEDLDFVSPVACTAASVLTNDEKGLISRWVDLGAPINLDRPRMRYTDDTLAPSLTLAILENPAGNVYLRVGAVDIESGIDYSDSLVQITQSGAADITIPFSIIPFGLSSKVGFLDVDVDASAVTLDTPLQVTAVAYDLAGNHQKIKRTMEFVEKDFSVPRMSPPLLDPEIPVTYPPVE